MGYNDPMPTTPEPCECGETPHTITLGERPDKFSGHWTVFCECGVGGLVSPDLIGAVFFWGMKHQRSHVKEPWLSEFKRAVGVA